MPRLPAHRRRRQLLDVALERFANAGYHETSMDDIAEAAGVTKPVLYRHFASKRDLYLQLLEDVGAELVGAIGAATAAAGGPREQVAAGFRAYLDVVSHRPAAFRLLFSDSARRDDEVTEAATRVEGTVKAAIATLIDADVDPRQRDLLAAAIVGMAEGAVRSHLATARSVDDPERMARQLAELAWAGLRGVRRID